MSRAMHRLKWLAAALLSFLAGLSSADDTEIYVGDGSVAQGVIFPNVLFVLDTSSSMTNTDNTGITRLERMKQALDQIISSSNNVNMGLMRFHREGGPVLFPVSNIHAAVEAVVPEEAAESDLVIPLSASADDAEESGDGDMVLGDAELELINKPDDNATGSLEVSVSHGDDDAEQFVSTGAMESLSSSDLELMHEYQGTASSQEIVGVRFLNVTVPSGAQIESARIRFQLDETKGAGDPVTIALYGEASPAAVRYASSSNDIGDRTRTNASVSWSPETGLSVGDRFYTPDLSSVVQEIVDQDAWASGNPMAFIIAYTSGSGLRCVESYNGSTSGAPRLELTYSVGSGSQDQVVGLRFQQVRVPQRATVTGARLELQAARSHSDTANLTLRAQDLGSALGFSADTGDISGRTTTEASVAWDELAAWTAGQRYQSPDLSSLIQEVVDRDDWCGGNPLALIVTGDTGVRRSAESFDGDSAAAPILYVSYDPDSVDEDACVNQTFQAAVVSGADDAEERSDQSMYMDSSDLELVEDGSAQTVGIRFRNVQIPKDTTIIKAELVFTTDETGSSASSLTIRGEAADDSAAIGTSSGNLSSRSTTSASASWSPAGWATVGETHATPDLVAIVQEIVNRSGWEAGNAMTFLITGSGTRTAESYDGSASGAPVLRVMVQGALGTGYVTVRDKLQEIVDGLNYKSGTPILDTLYEAASYYRGESVHYGRSRGFGSDPDDGSFGEDDRNRCEYTRLSHPASYTGGSVVRPVGCSEDEPNSTSCVDEYISGDPVYITPMTQWCQANYQILLSDGLGYGTQSVSLTNELFSAGYACSNHDDCSVELAEFLRKEDQNDTLDEDQTVTTYTIGFNLESTDPQFLRDVASAGGGSFYTADTAEELSTVFQSILADILSRSTSFTAPAVSVNAFNRLFHDNDVYFSLFLPQRSVRWSGNLKRYLVCAGAEGDSCTRGDIMDASSPPIEAIGANNRFDANSRSFWSLAADGGEVQMGGAGDNIPAYGSRLVYTYTGSAAPSNVDLSSAAHLITTTDAANAADDPLRVLLGAASLSDTDYSQLIYWILGQDVNDEDDDGQSTDDRWAFADPLHSQPLVVTYGRDGSNNPIKKIFIGSNDGALRMVNASTGVEEWVFIPQALLEMQHQLMVNASGDHLYGMDGDITVRLLDLDGDGVIEPPGDKVWIFAGMRRGGRNLYALDVTPGSTLTQGGTTDGIVPKLLWRIEGGVSSGFGALGQTWSAPRVAKIPFASSYKEVLLFGGGYQTDQDSGFATASVGNAIYAVDLSNGSLLFSVSGADSGATHELTGMDYPIPSSLALMDSSGDGLVDRIYVGDTGGQLWRLDLQRTDLGVSASGARLASVSSILSDSDKRKFFYPPDVAQLYDSDHSATAEYDLVIIVSGDRANPTETTVHNRVYGFRDYTIQGAIAADFATLDPSTDLYDATANLIQQGTDAQREAALAAIKQKKGWYMDLSESGTWIGEKGLSSPIILDNKAFFTTYVPGANESPNDSCGSPVEGYGRLYALNILNAAAVYPNWDGTGDTANLTKEDRDYDLWAGIPSNVVPVFQPGGVTLVVGGGGGGGTFDPDIDLPVVRTFWLQER